MLNTQFKVRPRSSRCVLLEFNRGTKELEVAILEAPPARRASQLGVDIQPKWANGAKVFVAGIEPDDFEAAGVTFRPRHVVICEAESDELLQALGDLRFRIRKLKGGCGKRVMRKGSAASSDLSKFLSNDVDIDEEPVANSDAMSDFFSDDEQLFGDRLGRAHRIEVHATFIDFRNPPSMLTRHTI